MEIESTPKIKDELDDLNLENRQSPSVQPTSRPLSDGSRDPTPFHMYKHRWTVEERTTLAILAQVYSNNWDEITCVFNRCHRSALRKCGGLRKAVVYAQFRDMRKYFDLEAALKNLALRAHLEHMAIDIGVQLICKKPFNKRKRAGSIDDSRTDYLPDEIDNETRTAFDLQAINDLTLPKTPTTTTGVQQHNLPTPPESKKRRISKLTADKGLAQIGFRASTSQSQGTYSSTLGIRAGAFLNCPDIPLARDLSITRYREEALHHVTKNDHSRPSMFISCTKNPIRALHLLFHAPQGEKALILVDLNAADQSGNVEKAKSLNLKTTFKYSAAGEYLIFGGVDPSAIISYIPLSKLLSNMPVTPNDEDPFKFEVLQAHDRLSYARSAVKKGVPPMTYSLGKAVGQLVGILCVPPRHFETAVWAFVQDYKFYSAEGGKKRVHWADNTVFKDGAVQGYLAFHSDKLPSLEIENHIKAAREIIEIEDDHESGSDSDPDSSQEDGHISGGIEDWVHNTQSHQAPLQYYDIETRKWMSKDHDLSDDFLADLQDLVDSSDTNPKIDRGLFAENDMDISQDREMANDSGFGGFVVDTNSMTEDPVALPVGSYPEEFRNLDELCTDVMKMHGDGQNTRVRARRSVDTEYEYSWTGI